MFLMLYSLIFESELLLYAALCVSDVGILKTLQRAKTAENVPQDVDDYGE
jgi:hypothetical protein